MWLRSHSKVYQGIKKEDIWQIWIDVNNWPSWHGDLDECKMDGPFSLGNHFMLKPTGAPAVKVQIVEVEDGREFTDCTEFFGAKMYNTHAMLETEDGLELRHKLVVTGPLKWLWIMLVAKKVAKTVPDEMDLLVHLSKQIT